jgi:hypothetical protein
MQATQAGRQVAVLYRCGNGLRARHRMARTLSSRVPTYRQTMAMCRATIPTCGHTLPMCRAPMSMYRQAPPTCRATMPLYRQTLPICRRTLALSRATRGVYRATPRLCSDAQALIAAVRSAWCWRDAHNWPRVPRLARPDVSPATSNL